MRLTFRPAAIADIQAARDYITSTLKSPAAATKLVSLIWQAALLLKTNPCMGAALSGKFDVESELRFLVVQRQILFYEIHEDTIDVVRVLDGRRDYIALLFE